MKIICIGMNYMPPVQQIQSGMRSSTSRFDSSSASAQNLAGREKPMFFIKPDTAILTDNKPFYIPNFSSSIEYGCEIVVRINRVCKAIEPKFAPRYYCQVGLGVNFTARDLQLQCQEHGLPQEISYAFDNSAVITPHFLELVSPSSSNITVDALPSIFSDDIQNLTFELHVNGELQQRGCTSDMVHSIDSIIAHVSQFITLRVGDLIFTGTPARDPILDPTNPVSTASIGDHLRGTMAGIEMFDFEIK